MIEGVEVGVVFKQRGNGTWKASLRSNSLVNVQKICSVFGGGGHEKASGCTLYEDLDSAAARIRAAIEESLCRE